MTLLKSWRAQLSSFATWLRGSLWAIPSATTAAAVVLAFATVSLDMRLANDVLDADLWFVFGVGPDGVRGVLTTIAGSIITVTGVVFSITVVALQLASTQYSPRVLRTFLEDRLTHVVLGVFIGTFTYCLLVLRTVRAETSSLAEFVPFISVTVAVVLGLGSVACLIFFVHHIAQSVRAAVIIKRLTQDASDIAKRAFPRDFGQPEPQAPELPPVAAADTCVDVRAEGPGYLNAIAEESLFSLDGAAPVVVRMRVRMGDYLRTGDVVAVIEGGQDGERLANAARRAFRLGAEAAGRDDIALGITRLAEVAVRALSPGINDTGTANACLDALSEVLVVTGCRDAPHPIRASPDGRVRLVARYHRFDDLVELAFGPVRHHGAGIPSVANRLLDALCAVGARLPFDRRAAVTRQVELAMRAAEEVLQNEDERRQVRDRAASVRAAIQP